MKTEFLFSVQLKWIGLNLIHLHREPAGSIYLLMYLVDPRNDANVNTDSHNSSSSSIMKTKGKVNNLVTIS